MREQYKAFHKLVLKMRQQIKKLPNTRKARRAFLIRWSNVRCEPHKGLTPQERRARFNRTTRARDLSEKKCWVCISKTRLVRHHVIQVQHGGGNWHINIVPICEGCHAEVHPWMDASAHPLVQEVQQWDGVR